MAEPPEPTSRECSRVPTRDPAPGDQLTELALDLRGVVETALARALLLAAEGRRWELVAQIANELAERRSMRKAGPGNADSRILDSVARHGINVEGDHRANRKSHPP